MVPTKTSSLFGNDNYSTIAIFILIESGSNSRLWNAILNQIYFFFEYLLQLSIKYQCCQIIFHLSMIQQFQNMMYMMNLQVRLRFHSCSILSKDMYSVSYTIRLIYLLHMLISNKHIFQGCMSYFLNLSSEVSFPTKMECYCHMLYNI